ncbi:hypothetical protein LOK49_LG10G02414 [Camellia lanceoleosa]|uniref:Uncharacterized protein n=1 Tax=Camellia lanceoleosa TaxID=1840588 RepID=A0ACC0GC65_9ERIC|nr:hypothetical protein LOK49_LG10G02414 [Camellia lanceoleosa]
MASSNERRGRKESTEQRRVGFYFIKGKDDENEICLVGMKSAGNELVPTIGSSVELGIASQVVKYFTDPNAIEPPDMQILFPFVESAPSQFIEGDFDAYVERIRKPYVWGGELELLMASHLLKYVGIVNSQPSQIVRRVFGRKSENLWAAISRTKRCRGGGEAGGDVTSAAADWGGALGQSRGRTQKIIWQVQPTAVSEERRGKVIDYVQRLNRGCIGCEVFPFGSVPLKTYLPDGDIDLTAFGGASFEDALVNDVVAVLEAEDQNGAAEFVVKDVQLIRAEVCVGVSMNFAKAEKPENGGGVIHYLVMIFLGVVRTSSRVPSRGVAAYRIAESRFPKSTST